LLHKVYELLYVSGHSKDKNAMEYILNIKL